MDNRELAARLLVPLAFQGVPKSTVVSGQVDLFYLALRPCGFLRLVALGLVDGTGNSHFAEPEITLCCCG
jgi:hypothetical protein